MKGSVKKSEDFENKSSSERMVGLKKTSSGTFVVQLLWYNIAYTLDLSCHGRSPTTSKRTAFESFGNPTILEGQGWPPIFLHLQGDLGRLIIIQTLLFKKTVATSRVLRFADESSVSDDIDMKG